MNTIESKELFENLRGFLKSKGVELQEGSYTRRVQQACGLLTDAINLSHDAVQRGKRTVDTKLDELRQVIHEKTAPKARATPPEPPASPAPDVGASAAQAAPPAATAATANPAPRRSPRPKAKPQSAARRRSKPKSR
jgi:hypothetical protein